MSFFEGEAGDKSLNEEDDGVCGLILLLHWVCVVLWERIVIR
jgi:hypothetical protein